MTILQREREKRKASSGLTLIEVLVALTLVAAVLLPVMIGLSQALVSTSESSIVAAATSIGRQRVEEIKAVARSATFDFASLESQPRETADLNPGDGFFEMEVIVETVRADDASHSGLKKVEVAVYRAGSDRATVTMTTYVMPFGI